MLPTVLSCLAFRARQSIVAIVFAQAQGGAEYAQDVGGICTGYAQRIKQGRFGLIQTYPDLSRLIQTYPVLAEVIFCRMRFTSSS